MDKHGDGEKVDDDLRPNVPDDGTPFNFRGHSLDRQREERVCYDKGDCERQCKPDRGPNAHHLQRLSQSPCEDAGEQ